MTSPSIPCSKIEYKLSLELPSPIESGILPTLRQSQASICDGFLVHLMSGTGAYPVDFVPHQHLYAVGVCAVQFDLLQPDVRKVHERLPSGYVICCTVFQDINPTIRGQGQRHVQDVICCSSFYISSSSQQLLSPQKTALKAANHIGCTAP
jgi:hypothetical protein